MFQEYRNVIELAQEHESKIKMKFNKQRESNTIEIQEKMRQEADSISKNQHLKDYNPMEYYNSITTLKHKYDQIIESERTKLENLQKQTDELLQEKMKYKPKLEITEICKLIGTSSENTNYYRYICRVWFTLIPIEEFDCKPGDPIRVEWVDMVDNNLNDKKRDTNEKSIRNGKGITGLNIPHFVNTSQLSNVNQLFSPDNWGSNSNQKTLWLNWVRHNRPIPE